MMEIPTERWITFVRDKVDHFPSEFLPILRLIESGPEIFRRDNGSHCGEILRIGGIGQAEHQRGRLVIRTAENFAFPCGKKGLPHLFEIAVLINFYQRRRLFIDLGEYFNGITFGIDTLKAFIEGDGCSPEKTARRRRLPTPAGRE